MSSWTWVYSKNESWYHCTVSLHAQNPEPSRELNAFRSHPLYNPHHRGYSRQQSWEYPILSIPVYELEQVFVVQDKKLIFVVACQSGDMRRTRSRRESDLHYGG
jgi:hypothetical protein